MQTDKNFEQILKYLKRIDVKLTHLINKPSKNIETWVRYSAIKSLTGWDKHGLYKARKNGYVNWKKDKKGFWYLLESLNPIHYKKTDTSSIY